MLTIILKYIKDVFKVDITPVEQRSIVDIERDWKNNLDRFKLENIGSGTIIDINGKIQSLDDLNKYDHL